MRIHMTDYARQELLRAAEEQAKNAERRDAYEQRKAEAWRRDQYLMPGVRATLLERARLEWLERQVAAARETV